MKVFCDLDGTLIDIAPRHHRVYAEVTRELGGAPLPRSSYWNLKRRKTKWPELLAASALAPTAEPEFLARFIEKIEDLAYLRQDTLLPGAREAIRAVGQSATGLYLVSLRRHEARLEAQLGELDLAAAFDAVLSGHSDRDGHDVKTALLRDLTRDGPGMIIGDTEADIVTGKNLNLITVAVTSGIRDERFLRALEPDYLLGAIGELPALLPKIFAGP